MSDDAPPRTLLWPGVPLAFGSAILFDASTPFAKLLLGSMDAQMLAGLLYLGAGPGLALVHFARKGIGLETPVRRYAQTPLRTGRLDRIRLIPATPRRFPQNARNGAEPRGSPPSGQESTSLIFAIWNPLPSCRSLALCVSMMI